MASKRASSGDSEKPKKKLVQSYIIMPSSSQLNMTLAELEDSDGIWDNADAQFNWLMKHARFGYYSLDIRICSDHGCCKPKLHSEFSKALLPFGGYIPPRCRSVS